MTTPPAPSSRTVARRRIGVVINPVAGMGGRVGLKGTDGAEALRLAVRLGARAEALARGARALRMLEQLGAELDLVVYGGSMGEDAAREAGIDARAIGRAAEGATTAEDTVRAVGEMEQAGCELIVFVGGDGTARDVMRGLTRDVPVLGVPAGCKMHSGVFATSPESAGRLIAAFAEADAPAAMLRMAEVMDIDEAAFRENRVSAELHGYVQVPFLRRLLQSAKRSRPASDRAELEGVRAEFDRLLDRPGVFIVAGGSTTHAATTGLGLEKTLLGVDAIADRRVIGTDLNEQQIVGLAESAPIWLVVSVIGAQGYILGRGNQQLSPAVIRHAGRSRIVTLATMSKLTSLTQRRLLVDTGDPDLDRALSGHMRVHVGYRHEVVMPIGT